MPRKKYSEVEELQGMLEKRRKEFRELEETNRLAGVKLVSTVQSLCAKREDLIAQIHQVDEWIKLLGYKVPGQENK